MLNRQINSAGTWVDTEEFLVVYNPQNPVAKAQSAAFCEAVSAEFDDKIGTLHVPSEPDIVGNVELFRQYLPADNRITPVLVGGDGVTSNSLNALMETGSDRAALFLATGNACDIASMAVSKWRQDPLAVLNRGHYERIRPLAVTAGDQQRRAFGYFGIGFDAAKAITFNSHGYRNKQALLTPVGRCISENLTAVRGIGRAPTFQIREIANEQEDLREAVEILFPNGSRMAKRLRFGGLALAADQAGRLEVPNPALASLIRGIGQAAVGAFEKFGPDKIHEFQIEYERPQDAGPLHFQRDGEPEEFASGTVFRVQHDAATVPIFAMP